MKNSAFIALVFAGLAAFVSVLAVIGGIALALTIIPWLLYNHIVVPTFHTQPLGFWTCFCLLWLLSIVGRFIFGRGSSK